MASPSRRRSTSQTNEWGKSCKRNWQDLSTPARTCTTQWTRAILSGGASRALRLLLLYAFKEHRKSKCKTYLQLSYETRVCKPFRHTVRFKNTLQPANYIMQLELAKLQVARNSELLRDMRFQQLIACFKRVRFWRWWTRSTYKIAFYQSSLSRIIQYYSTHPGSLTQLIERSLCFDLCKAGCSYGKN